jgi:hypothetical protein
MKSRIPLDVIDVAKPCPADWNEMRGSDRVRFCKHCQLNVYNLSAMSRDQAQELVNSSEGRLCVSFYRRADGTVITSDCGGGLRFAARRAWQFASAAVAMAACILLAPLGWGSPSNVDSKSPMDVKPDDNSALQVLGGIRAPEPRPQPIRGEMVMGDVAVMIKGKIAPPPPATQPTTAPATEPTNP